MDSGGPCDVPWCPSTEGHSNPQGRCPPEGGAAPVCLGVLTVVPGPQGDRSDPADQAPTVTDLAGQRRSAGAGCLRRSVVCSTISHVKRLPGERYT